MAADAEKAMTALAATGAMTAMSDNDRDDDNDNDDNGYEDDGQQQWRRLPTPVPINGLL